MLTRYLLEFIVWEEEVVYIPTPGWASTDAPPLPLPITTRAVGHSAARHAVAL